jgi:cytochrome c553
MLAFAAILTSACAAHAQAPSKGDRELGQYLSAECVSCHQASGRQTAGVPAIVGWPDDQFVAVMLAYKNKERPNEIMRTIAARLSREEIEALAAYFGAKPAAP